MNSPGPVGFPLEQEEREVEVVLWNPGCAETQSGSQQSVTAVIETTAQGVAVVEASSFNPDALEIEASVAFNLAVDAGALGGDQSAEVVLAHSADGTPTVEPNYILIDPVTSCSWAVQEVIG